MGADAVEDAPPLNSDASQEEHTPKQEIRQESSNSACENMAASHNGGGIAGHRGDCNLSPLIDEDECPSSAKGSMSSKAQSNEKDSVPNNNGNEYYELADIVEHEIQEASNWSPKKSQKDNDNQNSNSSEVSSGFVESSRKNADTENDPLSASAADAARISEIFSNYKPTSRTRGRLSLDDVPQSISDPGSFVLNHISSLGGLSLDDDVVFIDKHLFRACYYTMGMWFVLVISCYWAAPPESIQWLTGAERNACLVELSILSTAVAMKHGPVFWENNVMEFYNNSPSGVKFPRSALGTNPISGVLAGGLVVQFIAVATAAIMVCMPVPVMIDPVFESRVHLIRWCEWAPLAGLMTLMVELMDAPEYDGIKFKHQMKKKYTVAILESASTTCGLFFPFCPNFHVWAVILVFSFTTYTSIIFSYLEKRNTSMRHSRGTTVDENELYDRARMSLALHGMCCVIWTLITVMYFVSSAGHIFVPKEWHLFHDPAATMISECFMDLIAKILYMSLIVEAHHAAFDEAKRANRRLAELKNTMSVVWENSSDTIAISVRKVSGNVTAMVSPSFFRPALIARHQEKVDDISAIILEVGSNEIKKKRDSITNMSRMPEKSLPQVGMKIIHKEDFAGIDLHSAAADDRRLNGVIRCGEKNDTLSLYVLAFTDMMARVWQSKNDELVFEHDAVLQEGGSRTKFEVKVTRLEENSIVVVIRDVSERYRRFEAEKRFVFETTARQKDAEANRFTRHEVKNGLLAAIEICGNIREQFSDDFNILQKDINSKDIIISEHALSNRVEHISELDRTLHEVLDLVLAETMARDVIHEMYVPRMERVDISYIMSQTRGFKADNKQFSLICTPSPLPVILSDQGLFKCIHGNAIRNAIKYGENGGKILTEATYDPDSGLFEMKVINMPGPGHDQLVELGARASELVFSHGTRLHKDSDLGKRSHSAGDGAWIIRKCATILGGTVDITFEKDRTVFTFRAPVKIYDSPLQEVDSFHLPSGVWGIGIDDSKIQRKLLRRFFVHAGIHEHHQIILGQNTEEISGFVEFVVDFVARHPNDLFLIIVDENLEMGQNISDHGTISGSECIQRIRIALQKEEEKRILALVRSANDSPKDLSLYKSRAHGYMPKVPLRGMSVREMVSPLWISRFPENKGDKIEGDDIGDEDELSRIPSIENLRDLTLISPAEVLSELEQIDAICVGINVSNLHDRWPVLWDKLHQLKGDLQSVNVEHRFQELIDLIEALRGETPPSEFMSKWLRIRSKVVALYGDH